MDISVQAEAVDVASELAFVRTQIDERTSGGDAFFRANAAAIASCSAAMADRFFAGAVLLVFGTGSHATDSQHNSVEFVHPVLPGCRALPAMSLSNDIGTLTALLDRANVDELFAHQLRVLGRPSDIALAFGHAPLRPPVVQGLAAARERGMLTVALTSGSQQRGLPDVDFRFHVDNGDQTVAHELHLATYHMLWELVHIVLNHRGIGGAP
jgi:D-sedoheptulose 7-phosphate isomerase